MVVLCFVPVVWLHEALTFVWLHQAVVFGQAGDSPRLRAPQQPACAPQRARMRSYQWLWRLLGR
jgi:hypothetical protein